MNDRARFIDHTNLAPNATRLDIDRLCDEAMATGFHSVCVNPQWVSHCVGRLAQSSIGVCTVVGFPLGATTSLVKSVETQQAVALGATEIDMVINIGAVKDHDWDAVSSDILAVVESAGTAIVKVILEVCLLTEDEIVSCCNIAIQCGASFVKTSTGFSKAGADVASVRLMSDTVAGRIGVKASGGISTPSIMTAMLEAGATRIGASAGTTLLGDQQ